MKPRHDIYSSITAQLVAAIEAGAGEWRMPWHHRGAPVMRPRSAAGRAYSGINRLVLWASAETRGFESGTWATFQQWKSLDARVRKGETGTHVILWKRQERDETATADDQDRGGRFFARSFVVFNRSQVDGAGDEDEDVPPPMSERIAAAKAFLEHSGVPVTFGLHDAYYRPDEDRIYMPARSAFESDEAMIATEGHELVHATGHASRLARDTLRDYHKERAIRAREELVAEIGASFLMADLGLAYSPRPDHAAYVASWLRALENDTRAIFRAAAAAQAATDWIHSAVSAATANADPLPLAA
ncbi:MAG TPA: zincin-like metallopeptidase domain-containing protein [Sphingopyxis sp.]|nr:zincin-like metallopeptidase domain-containing protein [Sphingopyxis sp.]